MWVTVLAAVMLVLLIAALAYVAFSARKLEDSLAALTSEQGDRLRSVQRELDRVRHTLESGMDVAPIDVQRGPGKRQASA